MNNNVKSNDHINAYLNFENAFSSEECNKLIDFFNTNEQSDLSLIETDIYVKNTKVSFLSENNFNWVSEKLINYINQVNAYFNFDISELKELQIIKAEQDSIFDWHSDIGRDIKATRKISVIVFLSKPEDYQGGEINFSMVEPKIDRLQQTKGSILLFPALRPYISEIITSGTRYTLSGWMHGNSFR